VLTYPPMSKPVSTDDQVAPLVAEQAYHIVRVCRLSDGATDLPEWDQIPEPKKSFLTKAARAALGGAEVWEVWAHSCGEAPTDATAMLWRQKPPVLQLLPKVYEGFGKAVALHTTGAVPAPPRDLLDDEVPSFDLEDEGEDSETPMAVGPSDS
jgi:hypothetical protein